MRITAQNETERRALRWAVGALESTGWSDSHTLEHDADLPAHFADDVALVIERTVDEAAKPGSPRGLVVLPDTNAGEWVALDLMDRVDQLADMTPSGLADQLAIEGDAMPEARAQREANLISAFSGRVRNEIKTAMLDDLGMHS